MTTQVQVASDSFSNIDKILNSSLISYFFIGILVYIAILWIAIILWVTKDIINRTNNVFMQIFCISLVIFLTPLFGLVIYLIARPSKTLIEQYYEDFELNLIQTEEDSKDIEHCPSCHCKTDTSFKFCSMCGIEIANACTTCDKLVKLQWTNCPFCGAHQERKVEIAPIKEEKEKKEVKKVKKQEKKVEATEVEKKSETQMEEKTESIEVES